MTHNGVPIAEATAKDFMMVRAALVKRLGGANQALVWSRIWYRCDDNSRVADEHDGAYWWKASHGVLAEETGLSEKQARTAVEDLVKQGFLERSNFGGRTFSYRPVTYLPNWADSESARIGSSIRPDGQIYLPDSAVVPLIETRDIEDTPVVPRGDQLESAFNRLWEMWPTPRRGTRKKSGASFRTAVKVVGVRDIATILDAAAAHVDVWRTWAAKDQQFVPAMTTWLNQERWTADLPQRRGAPAPDERFLEGLDRGARLAARMNSEQRGLTA